MDTNDQGVTLARMTIAAGYWFGEFGPILGAIVAARVSGGLLRGLVGFLKGL